MLSALSPLSIRWNDLTHPVLVGLILAAACLALGLSDGGTRVVHLISLEKRKIA